MKIYLLLIIGVLLVILLITLKYSEKYYNIELPESIHVYLISLPKNTERRINFEKKYKGKYDYVPAVDGGANKDTDLFKNWSCLTDGHAGTKGLQMSNVKIFQDAIKKGYEWILIFEDDAEPPGDFDFIVLETIKKYPDSRVIYLDNRNKGGDGFIPGCCTSCLLYHNSVFELLARELNPETSLYMKDYANKPKEIVQHTDCLFDWFLANTLAHYNIKTSSEPLVASDGFKSDIAM